MAMIKIVIVDDHPAFRQGLHLMLKELSPAIEIIEMDSGSLFIEDLEDTCPDLVFMDIRMPGINGIEVATIALKQQPKLRIIILTMFGEEKYLKEAMEVGVKGFLIKPPSLLQLKKTYNIVMDNGSYFPSELKTFLK